MPTKILAMETTPAPDRYAAVIVVMRCAKCQQSVQLPLREAARKLHICCRQPMAFRGHLQPCPCPSCQPKTEN